MSVIVPGNINCANYLELKARVDDLWEDSGARKANYIADVDTVKSILASQTARLKVLETPEKDRELKVWWPDDCRSDAPVDCGDQCDVDGPSAGTQCKNYSLDECFEFGWSWTEEQFRTSEMTEAEFEAPMLLRALKQMDEKLDDKAISLLDSSAGVNKYDEQYTVQDGDTYIPATAWNEDLMGYFDMLTWENKMEFARMASGHLMRQLYWKIQKEATNPDGTAAVSKLTNFGTPTFDRRLDTVIGRKALFLWNPNAIAIANKARHAAYGDAGRVVQNNSGPDIIWRTFTSKNVPSIVYDYYAKDVCMDGDITKARKLRFRGGFFQNPIGCDNDLTGVLKVLCGTP